jgi:transcriptional regulator with XRE-family HTH domain
MGIDASHISRIETGRRGVSLKTLEAFAKALELPTVLLVLAASGRDDLEGLDISLIRRSIVVTLLQSLLDKLIDGEG